VVRRKAACGIGADNLLTGRGDLCRAKQPSRFSGSGATFPRALPSLGCSPPVTVHSTVPLACGLHVALSLPT
jgi:hypothetical protein